MNCFPSSDGVNTFRKVSAPLDKQENGVHQLPGFAELRYSISIAPAFFSLFTLHVSLFLRTFAAKFRE